MILPRTLAMHYLFLEGNLSLGTSDAMFARRVSFNKHFNLFISSHGP
jgi:hypothetical protein